MGHSDKEPAKENSLGYYTDLSEKLFSEWRFYRMLSALIGALAIIPAGIDYELRFSRPIRKLDSFDGCEICEQNEIGIYFRIAALVCSVIAIILLIPYKAYYYSWMRNIPFTFKEYPPVHKVSVLEVMEMQRKRKISDYLFDGHTWVAIVLFMIFPYPGDDSTFHVPQQIKYKHANVCYYTSEATYAFMILRLAYLGLACLSYGKYQTDMARNSAEKYGVHLTPAFSMKCYIGANPMPILLFFLLIPGVIIFGNLARIFERPINSSVFNSTENAYWNIIITMTTVGYGDTFAISILGRLMVILSIFWGGIILSLTFVTVGQVLQLKQNEKRAIIVGREAANAIGSCLVTTRHDNKSQKAWEVVRNRLRSFLNFKNSDPSNETFIYHATGSTTGKMSLLEIKADKIADKLRKFGFILDNNN
ncbi:hypothetical protein SteCoe_5215 [Stentor coeruleus]|uniref:Potassium channel domain-containing protein n=1 Tax=Stentor coeruleus TaxID=5963 RepID=A0A1R2CT22_9CILI|nr:hypothetical protein SteCoe_5215 [Stentor coeruleus]